jgi:hypothetical protein
MHAEAEANGCGNTMINTEKTGNPVKDPIGDTVCMDADLMKRSRLLSKLRILTPKPMDVNLRDNLLSFPSIERRGNLYYLISVYYVFIISSGSPSVVGDAPNPIE